MNNVVWQPQPKQLEFMMRPEKEALYGGAAGGGKSEALVIEGLRQVDIPHYRGLILRKTYNQLDELLRKAEQYYPRAYPQAKFNGSKNTWTFPSGAKILFRSLFHDKDKLNFQGQAYDYIAFDELTHFTLEEYTYLTSRNRPNGDGTRCYIRATANPGGIGHGWVKDKFITAGTPMTTLWEPVTIQFPDGHTERQYRSKIFVPSSVFDNKILLSNDPDYLASLASLPEAEKKALLYGDWDSYSGQYFTRWKNDPSHYDDRRFTHVINPFEPDPAWTIRRSMDWGYSKPFSIGWWATDYNGTAYRIMEWYGCKDGSPDTGIELEPSEVFREIYKVEHEHPWLRGKQIDGVADPACWGTQTGVSVAEVAAKHHIYFQKADNSRLPGWWQVKERLKFDDKGYPKMQIFNTCKDTIRTIPLLQHDERKVEDLNTKQEDHAADDIRYFCMSRPLTAKAIPREDDFYKSPLHNVFGFERGDLAPAEVIPPMIVREIHG